ncbi:Lrp/AsnC ligand binding domain-containing protein [Cupriavidus basilensis]
MAPDPVHPGRRAATAQGVLAAATGLSIPATRWSACAAWKRPAWCEDSMRTSTRRPWATACAPSWESMCLSRASRRCWTSSGNSPRVLECHHVSGNDSYMLSVVATDLEDLELFLSQINGFGEETSDFHCLLDADRAPG